AGVGRRALVGGVAVRGQLGPVQEGGGAVGAGAGGHAGVEQLVLPSHNASPALARSHPHSSCKSWLSSSSSSSSVHLPPHLLLSYSLSIPRSSPSHVIWPLLSFFFLSIHPSIPPSLTHTHSHTHTCLQRS